MSNIHVTYLVGAGCAVIALAAFITLVVAPALSATGAPGSGWRSWCCPSTCSRRFVGVGVVLGAWIVLQWPRF